MLSTGKGTRNIARHFNCSQSITVKLQQCHWDTGTTYNRARYGQLCVTTEAQDRHLVLQLLRNLVETAVLTSSNTIAHMDQSVLQQFVVDSEPQAFKTGALLFLRSPPGSTCWPYSTGLGITFDYQLHYGEPLFFSVASGFNISFADGRIWVWSR